VIGSFEQQKQQQQQQQQQQQDKQDNCQRKGYKELMRNMNYIKTLRKEMRSSSVARRNGMWT
jgi:hypothetical protein